MKTLIYRANLSCSRSRANVLAVRCIRNSQRRLTSTESTAKPLEAGGELPGVANSKILRTTRDTALKTPGIRWIDAESPSPDGGRETRKMNMYQAVSLLIFLKFLL
jgi:2-oxoisovalerate dehydrogenase E1 component beta subunit